MNTIANIAPTPAFAATPAGRPRRLAPGIGLTLAGLVSIALWGGLAQIAIALAT